MSKIKQLLFLRRIVCLGYLISLALSLFVLVEELAKLLTPMVTKHDDIPWTQVSLDGLYSVKGFEIIFYILGCGFFILYAIFVHQFISKKKEEDLLIFDLHGDLEEILPQQIIRIFVFCVLNVLFCVFAQPRSLCAILAHILFWSFLFQLPFLLSKSHSPLMNGARRCIYLAETFFSHLDERRASILALLLLAVVTAQFLCFFSPFFERPKIMSDFFNLSETTYLNNEEVDNIAYLNKHHLMSLYPRYDPRNPSNSEPSPDSLGIVRLGSGGKEYANLLQSPPLIGKALAPLNPLLPMLEKQVKQIKLQNPTEEESLFIKENELNFHWQVMDAGLFYHQSYLYGPINEINLGRPTHDIFVQYGHLITGLSWLLTLLMGGVSLNHTYTVLGLHYVFYYLFLVFVVWKVFRQWEYVLFVAAGSCLAYVNAGFMSLYLAPGYSPARHIFDILLLFIIHEYWKTKSLRALICGFIFCIIALLNSKEFGLMLASSLSLAMFWFDWQERRNLTKAHFFVQGAGLVGIFAAIFMVHIGPDYVSSYFFYGLATYPAQQGAIFELFLGLMILALIFFQVIEIPYSPYVYTFGFWSVYCLGTLLYPVWAGRWVHMMMVVPALIILVLLLLKLTAIRWRLSAPRFDTYLLRAGIFICVLSNGIYIFFDNTEYDDYNAVFKSHKTYIWPFQAAQVETTLDPKYFSDSVDLLKKYNQANGIYILSKYDFILPFLAEKFSAMPYPSMVHFLFSEQENDFAISFLKSKKPDYLFVDRDINREMIQDVISPDSWVAREGVRFKTDTPLPDAIDYERSIVYNESIQRALGMINLKKIYTAIAHEYDPIESSMLLTVYKRKPDSSDIKTK